MIARAPRFTRWLAPLAVLAALALGFGVPRAHAAGGNGVISGVVRNGTHATVVAGQQVTLQLTIGSNSKDMATTTSDARGHFTFSGLDASASSDLGGSWAVYTTFQGGKYVAGPINLATNPTQTTTLTVYDATQDSSALSVSVATILVRQPDVKHGLIGIGEFITIHNGGKKAFVGSLPASGGSTNAMPSLLRFSLPSNAQNVTTGVGFFGTDAIQIGSGFAAAATVPPGQTEFAFAYDLPYTGTTVSVPYKAEYPTGQVVTLVSPNMLVRSAAGESAQGIVTAFGARYQVYTANNLALNAQTSVHLYDLPTPGEAQDLNVAHLFWLGGGLLALLALLLALYLWRGALAVVFRLIPASARVALPATSESEASAREAERDRLLREALALERRRDSGALTLEQFKQANVALRERLRAVMAETSVLAEPVTPAASEVETTVDASTPTSGGAR